MATQGFEQTAEATKSFGEQVNEVVSSMVQDEKGKWQLPEGIELDEPMQFAVTAERRRRSTESALGKTRLQLKAKETVNSKLKERVVGLVAPAISEEDAAALEELKFQDPDAWYREKLKLEQGATSTLQTEIDGFDLEASQQAEIEQRLLYLDDFNERHPGVLITKDVLDLEVPPSITKKLSDGKISFEQYIDEAYKFLTANKVVGDAGVKPSPNLGNVGGGAEPLKSEMGKQEATDYKSTIF